MRKLTASGSAASAGIEYQQRISAWFLMGLLLDLELPIEIEELKGQKVSGVFFETTNPIDDLRISFANDLKLLAQIKRSIAFSSLPQSDFYKTLHQFVDQFLINPDQYFALMTSPRSSSKVTEEWRKILESIRLNDLNFSQNPLTRSETNTLNEYLAIVKVIYKDIAGQELSEESFTQFSKRVYVIKFDIESDMPHEQVAILMLGQKCNVNPFLVWNALVTSCLHLAKSRFSINREGALLRFGRFLKSETSADITDNDSFFKAVQADNISCGKEILLLSGENMGKDYLVFELFRFEDDCSKRIRFESPDKFILANGDVMRVIYRASTFAGLERFANANQDLFDGKETVIIPANDIDGVDETPCAKAYQDYCKGLLARNNELHLCLQCGKPVTDPESIFVELDDPSTPSLLGVVHDECRKPIDRVLGVVKSEFFADYPFLRYFDVQVWANLIIRGQYAFRSLKASLLGKKNIFHLIWTPEEEYDAEYDYCVRIMLADGSFEYVVSRAKVERFPKLKAEQQAEGLNSFFEKGKSENDPICYTSKNKVFGPRSLLMTTKEIDEQCMECIIAEPVRYNKSIGDLHNQTDNYYTPLCVLVEKETEEPITINGHVVLITDPLHLNYFIENWKDAEVDVPENYEIRIIKNDFDFDAKIKHFFDLGYGLIADPVIDGDEINLVSGYLILSMEQAKRMHDVAD